MTEQLSARISTEPERNINSPQGFRTNFEPKITTGIADQVSVDDILGYYDDVNLPFFKFLTDNYAWCERYFCSHAGPTLPNRMLSITGDVQYDPRRRGHPRQQHGRECRAFAGAVGVRCAHSKRDRIARLRIVPVGDHVAYVRPLRDRHHDDTVANPVAVSISVESV